MTAIPDSLLKRIEDWCAEHPTGQILLHVADHKVKSFEFAEHGKVSNLEAITEGNISEAVRLNYLFPEPPIHKS